MSLVMHSGERLTLEAAPSTASSTSVGGVSYDGKIAGLYDLTETLGSGHFAVVKLARHVFTGAKVAVKVVDKTKLDDVSKAHLFQEVRCMKLVQHPNVVRLYEVIDTQTKLYLVLELGDGGDLYDYIMKHEGCGLSEQLARKYFRQILRAITYCHQLHVVHRDLKPENVVFFEKLGVVKLTDFGFSNKFQPGQKLETSCGSLAYSAPEILLGDSYDAPAVDIWSLGVILYMLVCGQPPFEKANDSETLTMIMDCKYTVPPQVSTQCRQLIGVMLVRDPKKRASLEEIAAHPWFTESADYDASDFLPLVSRQELTEEDHAFIVQKMINGNIATKEDILQSIDKNQYNHITATYYLLAEIRLRKRREEQMQKQRAVPLLAENVLKNNCGHATQDNKTTATESKLAPVPISISVCTPTPPTPAANETAKSERTRKCSIVREEEEEDSSYENAADNNELRVAGTRRESISDGRLNRSVQERSSSKPTAPGTRPVPMQSGRAKMAVPMDSTLAQKLNQIEQHSHVGGLTTMTNNDDDDDTSTATALRGMQSLAIEKLKPLSTGNNKNPVLTHRRTKLNKIRTPSCSSSEASDDDTKSRSKKKINKFVGDTPIRIRMHRRDSHDDSSDSQDQAFSSSGGSHAHASNIIEAANNSNVRSKDGQTQSKEQNKTDDTRKSHSHTQKHKKQSKEHADKHSHSAVRKSVLSSVHFGRRRIRESQSLDRITEAQEYELRHRQNTLVASDTHNTQQQHQQLQHIEQRNSLFNLNAFSLVETKEEYDDDDDVDGLAAVLDSDQILNTLNAVDASMHSKRNKKNHNNTNHHNIYNLNSIEELDLILEEKTLSKAVQVTSSRCFVTIKKIRRLGKYFPVVNFS